MVQRLQSVLLFMVALLSAAILFLPLGYYHIEMNKTTGEDNFVEVMAQLNGASVQVGYTDFELIEHQRAFADGEKGYGTLTVYKFGSALAPTLTPILLLLVAALSMFAIFLFRNRPLQLKVAYLVVVLLMVFIAVSALLTWQLPDFALESIKINGLEKFSEEASPKYGFFIAPVTVLLALWAARRIRKDERLVRDADRFH